MPCLRDLRPCAERHLAHYVHPQNKRAFLAYDVLGDPARLLPVDVLAPALLDAPVRGAHLVAMHGSAGQYRALLDAMQAVLADEDAAHARFEEQDLDAATGPWRLVRAALQASDRTAGLKASKVTKILHRKRPSLVPIFDSRVAGFYGVSSRTPWLLWPLLKTEMLASRDWLEALPGSTRTPDGRQLSALRVLDIVIWEHSWGCESR